LTAFAVQDPAAPTRFVAALLFPETQLLIVAAVSTSPDYIRAQIAEKQYAEVYSALNASAAPETKLFFQDMGCDGLSRDGEQVDVMYDETGQQVLFDGQGKISGLSKNEYAARFGHGRDPVHLGRQGPSQRLTRGDGIWKRASATG
jgi:hypothetical protein